MTLADEQILNQFATNDKIHTQKKYKFDFKNICKYDFEKYNASAATWWSNLEIEQVAQHIG